MNAATYALDVSHSCPRPQQKCTISHWDDTSHSESVSRCNIPRGYMRSVEVLVKFHTIYKSFPWKLGECEVCRLLFSQNSALTSESGPISCIKEARFHYASRMLMSQGYILSHLPIQTDTVCKVLITASYNNYRNIQELYQNWRWAALIDVISQLRMSSTEKNFVDQRASIINTQISIIEWSHDE